MIVATVGSLPVWLGGAAAVDRMIGVIGYQAPGRQIVALGPRRYAVERPFGRWPSTDGRVTDVAVSQKGVHVLLREDPFGPTNGPRVVTVDEDGGFLSAWGADLVADAHMIAVDGERLLIVDRDAHQVVITSLRGERLGAIGERHRPLEPFNHPTCVAAAPDGSIYVSDGYAGSSIHHFARDGQFVHSWGSFGEGPGQFINPHALWVMRDGRVVVADRENGRLQVFDPGGALLAIWRGFRRPADLWGDGEDLLYVVDAVPSLTLLDGGGTVLGRCRPVLDGAHGISGDAAGRLYLAEGSPSRVTRLTPVPS